MNLRRRQLAALTFAATAAAGISVVAVPAANAAPVAAQQATSVSAVSAAASIPAVKRTSVKGVKPSAYKGKYYSAKYESTRKCIVRRESGGNYHVTSPGGKYRGAYQFNQGLANVAARKMHRSDLVGKNIRSWSRLEQDQAFWTIWNHGKGKSHWASTRRGC